MLLLREENFQPISCAHSLNFFTQPCVSCANGLRSVCLHDPLPGILFLKLNRLFNFTFPFYVTGLLFKGNNSLTGFCQLYLYFHTSVNSNIQRHLNPVLICIRVS